MTELTQCVADGGLINPVNFPAGSADLDPSAMTGSAAALRSMGQAVSDRTSAANTRWGGLSGCYEAPEQDQVYALLGPAVTSAVDLDSRFGDAAAYLDTYAHALEGIRPRLADLERRAAAFRASVVNGVEVDASESADAGFGDHVAWAFDWVPGVDERTVTVPWTEDGDSVEKNTALLEEYGGILSDISAAVAACANGVNGLVTGMCVAPVETIPAEAFTSGEVPMPWGSAALEDRNCRESVGHGFADFGTSFAQGVGMLVVGYNPETGDWWNGSAYGQAWGGLGDLAGSLVLMASPVGWVAAGMAVTGNTGNGFSDFMYDRAVVLRNAGGALVGWDPGAEDGWHKWREDGVAAGTTSALNIATFFIPGAGEVAGGLKAGSIGARVVQIAGATSEFVVQGGSWVVRGGIRVVADLRVAVTRFSLDDLLASVRPRLVEDPVTGMRFPVFGGRGGLFTAMTAHTPDVPGPHPTSVGDGLFGGREGGSSSGGSGSSGGSPTGPHLDEPAATADGPPQADHPSHADSPAHNDPRTDADTGSEHGGTGQERPAEVGDPSSSDGIPPKHEDDAAGSGSEDADGGTPTHHTTTPAVGAGSEPGWLEGQPDFAVRDPANPGREITDIDATEGHVLWEEKSATGATDIPRWVQKHIYGKFQRYMEARKYLPFYEDADIGFRFTTGGVQPQFREAVEQAIADLREQNPDVVIREDWSE